MNPNSKTLFTLVVITFMLVQHFPTAVQSKTQKVQTDAVPATTVPAIPVPAIPVPAIPVPATPVPATPVPATGGLLSGSLINLNLNLCVFKAVGQFKTYCAEDYLNLVDLKAYLDNVFPTCFPQGIIIGDLLGLHVHLNVLDAIHVFLGLNGDAGVLTASLTNPANCSGGIFAREILVLTINLGLDVFNPYWCSSTIPLAQLIIKEGPCSGLTVAQVLALANAIISGKPCPAGITIDVILDILVKINLNFRAALINNLYLAIPKLLAVNLNLAC